MKDEINENFTTVQIDVSSVIQPVEIKVISSIKLVHKKADIVMLNWSCTYKLRIEQRGTGVKVA